jgi:Na+-driven multidrug efflux pump
MAMPEPLWHTTGRIASPSFSVSMTRACPQARGEDAGEAVGAVVAVGLGVGLAVGLGLGVGVGVTPVVSQAVKNNAAKRQRQATSDARALDLLILPPSWFSIMT